MTIERKQLPVIPYGVKVKLLAPNLKLFTDAEIAEIKTRFTENGRYHHYSDENGEMKKLKYTLYVHDGRYLAVYPGKKYLMAQYDASFGQVKVAQDLDTGEWVVDKALRVHPYNKDLVFADVIGEGQALVVNQQAIVSKNGKPAFFYRPFMSDEFTVEDGKYDIFMKFANGMDMAEWMKCRENIPVVVKLDMSLGLVNALMSVHQNGMLHRDVKPRNAVYELFHNETKLVDFGFAEPCKNLTGDMPSACGTPGYIATEISGIQKTPAKYSLKSDIFALGVALGVLWGFYEINKSGVRECKINDKFAGDFALKRDLQRLLDVMLHENAEVRPDLEDVLFVLQRMKSELPDVNRVLRGGVLDVSMWQDACLHQEKRKLLQELKTYDYIQLSDVEGSCSEYELMAIKRSLQNNFCVTSGDVLIGTQKEIDDYTEEIQNRVQEDGRIYRLKKIEYTARLRMTPESMPVAPHHDGEEGAEEYDWNECLTWFFGALREDIASFMPAANSEMSENIGCFGLFSTSNSPAMRRSAAAITAAFDDHPFYETEEEAYRDSLALSRY